MWILTTYGARVGGGLDWEGRRQGYGLMKVRLAILLISLLSIHLELVNIKTLPYELCEGLQLAALRPPPRPGLAGQARSQPHKPVC